MSDAFSRRDNPWHKLPPHPPYVLPSDDVAFVRNHNKLATSKYRIQGNSLPEPFIGNPNSAKLVLLNLNPGHDGSVEADHSRPDIKDAIFDNLYQKQTEYPFYPFNPIFAKTAEFGQTGVAKYWRERTTRLQKATGLGDAAFATNIFVIEWFPYPSENWFFTAEKYERTGNSLCPSQDYNFQLALSFLDDPRVTVLGMRSKRYWVGVDERFERIPFLNSCQNTRITPRNMGPGLFDKIVKMMTA